MNKIFLVKRQSFLNIDFGLDEYDSFICIAPDEKIARCLRPNGYGDFSSWIPDVERDTLIIIEIGKANKNQKPGIVLASFNAA